jgi:hypothetical protein
MLERTSKFILEVLPFLLSAAIAAVLVPGLIHSASRGAEAVVTSTASALESVHGDTLSSEPRHASTGKLAYR